MMTMMMMMMMTTTCVSVKDKSEDSSPSLAVQISSVKLDEDDVGSGDSDGPRLHIVKGQAVMTERQVMDAFRRYPISSSHFAFTQWLKWSCEAGGGGGSPDDVTGRRP